MVLQRIYLDYAATTPVDGRVVKVMIPYFTQKYGNTMSLHKSGRDVALIMEISRKTVASLINAQTNEIIFTNHNHKYNPYGSINRH